MDEKEQNEIISKILKAIQEKTELEKKMNQPILEKFVWEKSSVDNPANDRIVHGFGRIKAISLSNFVNIYLAHSDDEVYLVVTDLPGNTAMTIDQWSELIEFFKRSRDKAIKFKEDLKRQNLIKEKEESQIIYIA